MIDFVIAWVDGNDSDWLKEKAKYEPNIDKSTDNTDARYRDWDNLRYWFRAVEKYAPWVRKIHFLTWGHIPSWLDTNNPKLHIVNHKDYIPKEYLPTFNSHTIELNMHRIKGLSEQFVYFNDDMFLTKNVSEDDFFKNGLPLDLFALDAIYFSPDSAGAYNGNDLEIINKHFNKNKQFKKYKFSKYLIRSWEVSNSRLFDFVCFIEDKKVLFTNFKKTYKYASSCDYLAIINELIHYANIHDLIGVAIKVQNTDDNFEISSNAANLKMNIDASNEMYYFLVEHNSFLAYNFYGENKYIIADVLKNINFK